MNHDENCNKECDGHHPVTWPQVANNALEMIGIGFLIVLTIWLCAGAPNFWK